MKYLLLIAIAALTISSCKSTQKNIHTGTELFTGANQWEMVSFQDKSIEEAGFTRRTPIIIINKDAEKISGNSGCNSFGGKITIKDNIIETGPIMATKMYCQGVPEQEFFKLWDGKIEYHLEGSTLTFSKNGQNIMVFKLKKADNN